MIAEYTREAGVRSLERLLGTIARKVAAKVVTAGGVDTASADDGDAPTRSTTTSGPARFKKEVAFRTSRPGVATGLAWTEAGGDVLFIEASLLPGGKEQIILTGQLGNVMQESARAARQPHPRRRRAARRRPGVPAASRICTSTCRPARFPRTARRPASPWPRRSSRRRTGRAVREDVAMTGEITLSGLVLPVGGIREKALAARRLGIKTVILPALNEPDLVDIPEELRRDMTFVFAETLEDVLAAPPLPAPAAAVAALRRLTRVSTRPLVYYISGHGFGHASRSIEVVNARARRAARRAGAHPHRGAALAVRPHGARAVRLRRRSTPTPASCSTTA